AVQGVMSDTGLGLNRRGQQHGQRGRRQAGSKPWQLHTFPPVLLVRLGNLPTVFPEAQGPKRRRSALELARNQIDLPVPHEQNDNAVVNLAEPQGSVDHAQTAWTVSFEEAVRSSRHHRAGELCRFDLDRHHPFAAPYYEVDFATALRAPESDLVEEIQA